MNAAAEISPCKVANCWNAASKAGLCFGHYRRKRERGSPTAGGTPHGDTPGSPRRFFKETVLLHHEEGPCLIWPFSRDKNGYAIMKHEGRCRIVSRLVCQMRKGQEPTPKHHAAHSCGNGHLGCVNPMHLRWATASENAYDRVAHGRVVQRSPEMGQ